MPIPEQFARGKVMGRGPYEKSGMVADTALHPLKTTKEHFEITLPAVEDEEERTLDLKVQLWYLPYGTMASDPFLWKEYTETITIKL
jgi:hypothetical protein